MQINSTKKNNLLKVVRSQRNYDYSSYLIERLIKEKRLNYLIEKIDNIKVKLHNSNIEKRDYFTSEEQFISILDKFIHYFKGNFIMPDVISDYSIRNILTINNPNLENKKSKLDGIKSTFSLWCNIASLLFIEMSFISCSIKSDIVNENSSC